MNPLPQPSWPDPSRAPTLRPVPSPPPPSPAPPLPGVVADMVQAAVLLSGLAVLLMQRLRVRQAQGLNEGSGQLPGFEEVWDASKFKFDDAEAAAGKAPGEVVAK